MPPLISTAATYERPDGVIAVEGPDRLTYLHSLLSHNIAACTPGDLTEFVYLDARGDHLAIGTAVFHAERVLLVVPADITEAFAQRLDQFRFMMNVTVRDLSETWAVSSLRNRPDSPTPPDWLTETPPPHAPGARPQINTAAPHKGGLVTRVRGGGIDWIGPRAWVQDCTAALNLPAASHQDWERWRIMSGRPGWGTEIVHGSRTQELGLLPTHVHLQKGCYPGQESIAKTYNLGKPRRILGVLGSTQELNVGDRIGEGRRRGTITSVASMTVPDTATTYWVGLGYIPLVDNTPPATINVGDEPAETTCWAIGHGVFQPGARA